MRDFFLGCSLGKGALREGGRAEREDGSRGGRSCVCVCVCFFAFGETTFLYLGDKGLMKGGALQLHYTTLHFTAPAPALGVGSSSFLLYEKMDEQPTPKLLFSFFVLFRETDSPLPT